MLSVNNEQHTLNHRCRRNFSLENENRGCVKTERDSAEYVTLIGSMDRIGDKMGLCKTTAHVRYRCAIGYCKGFDDEEEPNRPLAVLGPHTLSPWVSAATVVVRAVVLAFP